MEWNGKQEAFASHCRGEREHDIRWLIRLTWKSSPAFLFQPGGFSALFRERANLFSHRFVASEDVWPGTSLADRVANVQTPVERLEGLLV